MPEGAEFEVTTHFGRSTRWTVRGIGMLGGQIDLRQLPAVLCGGFGLVLWALLGGKRAAGNLSSVRMQFLRAKRETLCV